MLSLLGQELYDLLDKDCNAEIRENHVLKNYIFIIDENWDNDSLLLSIATRIGIYIPEYEYAPVALFLILKEFLTIETDPEKTRRIVEMNPTQYKNYLILRNPVYLQIPDDDLDTLYSNRLISEVLKN